MAQHPSVSIRPHAKAHKCPEIAALQLKLLGSQAQGVCAQKVSEAEALVSAGVLDVLLSNQVVAPAKMRRLARLAAAPGTKIGVCVDDTSSLRGVAAAAKEEGAVIDILVEVNVGQDRCGVDLPSEAAALAEAAASLGPSNGVRFAGIQAYHGGLQHVRDPSERATAVSAVALRAEAAVRAVERAGLRCGAVTGGGSGTYLLEAGSGVFTEVQPGSFCFGDADYAKNRQAHSGSGEWGGRGSQSLFVLTQVMSVNEPRSMAVVDAGLKAVSLDSGPPVVTDRYHALMNPSGRGHATGSSSGGDSSGSGGWLGFGVAPEYKCGGDEHGILLFPLPGSVPQLGRPPLPPRGTLLALQPGHCDPTTNLYDWIVAFRGSTGRVEGVWRVAGRGPGS